jgi:phospholipid/cholesterol/gamma-HCH transport system substrate-binding protein
LPPTLENANAAFASLNAAFPPTRAFAREILPGVRQTAATIDAAFPWIRTMRGLMAPAELQGLARDLSPVSRNLAIVTDQSIELLPQTNLVSMCARDVLLPTGDVVIQDEFPTGRENYKDFLYAMVGLAGEGQNVDGNGMMVRFQTGGGSQQVSLGPGNQGMPAQFGGLPTPPLGNRPRYPGKLPPYKPNAPCYKQRLPDLNGPAAAKTPPLNGNATTTSAGNAELQRLRSKLQPFGTRKDVK